MTNSPFGQREYLETVEIEPGKLVKRIIRFGNSEVTAEAQSSISEADAQLQDISTLYPEESGSNPPKGAKVSVHYEGRLASDGTVFDSNMAPQKPFSFNLGQGSVIKGWDLGVKTMKKGELAEFWIASEYAYGETGSGDKIKPGADLIFDVELLDWATEQSVIDIKSESILKKELKQPDDGVQKWKKPSEGAQVTVDFTLYALSKTNHRKVLRMLDQRSNFEFVTGEGQFFDGFESCVQHMAKTEHSRFRILDLLDKYGLDEEWSLKYGLPRDTPLMVDIFLRDFKNPPAKWEMNAEQKLEECERIRLQGNAYFQQKNYKMAHKKYDRALSLVEHDYDFDSAEEDKKKRAKELRGLCHANLSAVYLADGPLRRLKKVIEQSSKALDVDPHNIKCLYRRAIAYRERADFELAEQDLKAALALDPQNKAVLAEQQRLKADQKKSEQKAKQIYANMFK